MIDVWGLKSGKFPNNSGENSEIIEKNLHNVKAIKRNSSKKHEKGKKNNSGKDKKKFIGFIGHMVI